MRHASAMAATLAGAGVGLLGGLIGLGGAEFRLPLLVGVFAVPLRRAIVLNLAVSLFTVLAGLVGRFAAGSAPPGVPWHVIAVVTAGGMVGAWLGVSWLVGASSARLQRAVRVLLALMGGLLLIEAFLPGPSAGLFSHPVAQWLGGATAGIVLGVVSSLLGVAGGEMIIPTLVFGFGEDIKGAGTASLMISVPTVLMGLSRQAAAGLRPTAQEITSTVVPMSAGSIVGALAGAFLVAYAPGDVLKVLLGLVLIWSAARLGRHAAA